MYSFCYSLLPAKFNQNVLKRRYLSSTRSRIYVGSWRARPYKEGISYFYRSHYNMPHHNLLKPKNTTTKIIVVFINFSTSSSGKSLNDMMHTGVKLHLEVSDILFWIRQFHHLFATDITKMYRQINTHQDNRDYQKIFCINNQLDEVTYHLTTVTYGTKAASFFAVRTLLQFINWRCWLSLGHDRSRSSTTQLLQCMRVPISKVVLYSPRYHQGYLSGQSSKYFKIFGLMWLLHENIFTFTTTTTARTGILAERLILSEVTQIFDLLKFIAPVIIKAKMLLQGLWQHKLHRDEPLPSQMSSSWLSIRKELTSLSKNSIPWWLNISNDLTVELYGFFDAPSLSMTAVVYISIHSSTDTRISLVFSKNKVAPFKRTRLRDWNYQQHCYYQGP